MYNPKFRQNLIYTTQNDMSFVELISTWPTGQNFDQDKINSLVILIYAIIWKIMAIPNGTKWILTNEVLFSIIIYHYFFSFFFRLIYNYLLQYNTT